MILRNIANYAFYCYFLTISCSPGYNLQKEINIGEDWFRIHGVIVHNPIFVKIQFSVISGNFHFWQKTRYLFINSEEELNTWRITNPSLNFYDILYFLLFVCFYKSFGLKWLIVVFSAVLDITLIFIWRVSISFRMSKVKGNRLRNHGDISFQRGQLIKSNFQINGWLQTCDHDLLRSF